METSRMESVNDYGESAAYLPSLAFVCSLSWAICCSCKQLSKSMVVLN